VVGRVAGMPRRADHSLNRAVLPARRAAGPPRHWPAAAHCPLAALPARGPCAASPRRRRSAMSPARRAAPRFEHHDASPSAQPPHGHGKRGVEAADKGW